MPKVAPITLSGCLPLLAPIAFPGCIRPGGSHHPFGLYSTETRDSEKHPGVTVPNRLPPRLQTPMSPSSKLVDGKCHVIMRGWNRSWSIQPHPGTSEPGHSPVPCTVLQLAKRSNQRGGPYDSLGDFPVTAVTHQTQRESKEKQKTTETRTRHIPVSRFPEGRTAPLERKQQLAMHRTAKRQEMEEEDFSSMNV